MDPLEQGGLTAALVAMVMAVTKLVQSLATRRSGNGVPTKLALIEAKLNAIGEDVTSVKQDVSEINDRFFELREEVRLHNVREQVLREVKHESSG
jgi:hypothetical protein